MMGVSGFKGMFPVVALTSFLNRLGGSPSHFSELDARSPHDHALSSFRKPHSRINPGETGSRAKERDGFDVGWGSIGSAGGLYH